MNKDIDCVVQLRFKSKYDKENNKITIGNKIIPCIEVFNEKNEPIMYCTKEDIITLQCDK